MIIYKTINKLDGKFYVGQDSNNNPNYYGSGIRIKRAIKLHGKENFKKEIICECSSFEELDEKEIYWIKKLDALNPQIGYNIAIGGNSSHGIMTEEKRQKLRERVSGKNNPMYGKCGELHPNYGRKLTDEQKKIISDKLTGRKGNPMSEKHKQIVSKTHKGKKGSIKQIQFNIKTKSKPIIEFDLQMNFIKEWPSQSEAARQLNLPQASISRSCKNQSKLSNKFFRFKESSQS